MSVTGSTRWPFARPGDRPSIGHYIQPMLSIDILVFFVIGLLGGAHCIGMCGPLVTIYSGKLSEKSPGHRGHLSMYEVRQHTIFNLGRTCSYSIIGGVFGLLGGMLFVSMDAVSGTADIIRGSVGILIGAIVIAVGAYYLIGGIGGLDRHLRIPGVQRVTGALSSRIDGWVGGWRILGLGALHGFLPCPILYPAFLYAFAMGSAVHGVLALAALGLGTFPAVFLYGTVIDAVDPVNRQRLHRVLGVAFLILGYIPLSHGLMLFGIHLPHIDIPIYQPLDGLGHDGH